MSAPLLAIVMPCYNDSEVLPLSIEMLSGILDSLAESGKISPESYILCVDDGSSDSTWRLINEFHKSDFRVKGVTLAHNRGQQSALMAGLMTVSGKCDAAITIDADLQDDPTVIPEMVDMFIAGKDIVYGVRRSRTTDSWFKRTSAHAFYRLQRSLGMNTIYDHADYRLLSDKAIRMRSRFFCCCWFISNVAQCAVQRRKKGWFSKSFSEKNGYSTVLTAFSTKLSWKKALFIFFFKHKTAYEIGQ